jgi:glutathione synthase/RimK-type ligase-like ATP-grasp enzyme
MATQLIVLEGAANFDLGDTGCLVVDADDFLTDERYHKLKDAQVINLCKNYRYLSVGYYCSLLAEARRQRVIPSVKTMLDLSSKAMYSLDTDILDSVIQKGFKKHQLDLGGPQFEMNVFFGQTQYTAFNDLARQLFETFPCPLLSVRFQHQGKWRISRIQPLTLHRLTSDEQQDFGQALRTYLKRRWRGTRKTAPARYDLAILHNPDDPQPPSNKKALQAFIKAGGRLGINVELIEKRDYSALAEYDALFIRDTTRINHYTYRFAKKAESEGMVVIDDPASILRCTNKVYLAELLHNNRVATPKTVIVGKKDLDAAEQAIGYPMVLKVPDGSFSQGVHKVEDRESFNRVAAGLFENSELILAQEFLYTEFDWRIGILNKKPVYASQYFMSKKHWQIVHYDSNGKATEGAFKTMPIEQAPDKVVKTALKAANLIGNGLYGVDVKQSRDEVYVIEVNDNPNLDCGVEDAALKDGLYDIIMMEFLRRLELRHGR